MHNQSQNGETQMIRFDEFVKQCRNRGLMVSDVQREIGCSASQVWQWQHDHRVFVDEKGFLIRINTIKDGVNLNRLLG